MKLMGMIKMIWMIDLMEMMQQMELVQILKGRLLWFTKGAGMMVHFLNWSKFLYFSSSSYSCSLSSAATKMLTRSHYVKRESSRAPLRVWERDHGFLTWKLWFAVVLVVCLVLCPLRKKAELKLSRLSLSPPTPRDKSSGSVCGLESSQQQRSHQSGGVGGARECGRCRNEDHWKEISIPLDDRLIFRLFLTIQSWLCDETVSVCLRNECLSSFPFPCPCFLC